MDVRLEPFHAFTQLWTDLANKRTTHAERQQRGRLCEWEARGG
jgi:hypothetical protein